MKILKKKTFILFILNFLAYSKSFDRIFTGIMCDVFGTQKVLQTMEPLVSCSNPFATILSFHRVWRLGLKAVGR